MLSIGIKIDGLDRLRAALKRAPALTIAEIGMAVEKSALTLQSTALREAPVNKQTGGGNLRQLIGIRRISGLAAAVESKAKYSVYVHEGTRPHIIKPVNAKALANKRTGQFFGKIVHHPGTRPNPYMRRAVERSIPAIRRFFVAAMQRVLDGLK